MCGIAGFVGEDQGDVALLHRMCEALHHRGPDDEGFLVEGGAYLGMRRLAIIDVSHGAQPIYNEDHSVAIVYNGEVYNFPELRRQLQAKGHRFSTETDTECIVHLYEDMGERCVEALRGMFAFALWDRKAQRLLLGRDRVGKKPLFYRLSAGGIAFGSELNALVQDPRFKREVDPIALHHYLTYQYVPAPWSIYRGISKLPPAHTLVWENGNARLRRYWQLRYQPKLQINEAEAVERLGELIREATAIRLISERPLGAFLSGGIDSSMVVAAMAEKVSGAVKTFSIGFEEASFDERPFARLVAQRFGTDHHEFVVRPSALEILPSLVWHYGEPFADSSAVPSYYLARMTREHVTVALNGDGGDESFAGYDRYLLHRWAHGLPVPGFLRRPLGRASACTPSRNRLQWLGTRGRRLIAYTAQDPDRRYAKLMSHFDEDEKSWLYGPEMQQAIGGLDAYALLAEADRASDASDVIDRTLAVDVSTYLPGDLLVKMDIATMANSLEARSPLLDHHVMEFAASLPPQLKIRGMTTKYILKRLGRGWLPREVLNRRKMGFGVPIANWLRRDLRDLARDALTDSIARSRGYFEPASVEQLLTEHDAGTDHGPKIWALLQFELWHRAFVDKRVPQQPHSSL